MKRRSVLTALISIALMAGTALTCMAQHYVSNGSGRFTLGGSTLHLVKSSVDFSDDGTVACSVESNDKTRLRINGTYDGYGRRRNITVTEGLGRSGTRGSGVITLSN